MTIVTDAPSHGVPDLHDPLRGEGFALFAPFEGDARSEWLLTPDALHITARDDGTPDLSVEFVRGSAGDAYGFVNFTVECHYPVGEALGVLRAHYAGATLRPVTIHGGFIRLWPLGDIPGASRAAQAALTAPIALAPSGPAQMRFRASLPPEALTLAAGALRGNTLTLTAYAELEIAAVAPRLDLRVEVDRNAIVDVLTAEAGIEGRVISWQRTFELFRDKLGRLPMTLEGPDARGVRAENVALVLTHWTRMRLATAVPAPSPSLAGDTCMRIEGRSGETERRAFWDLATPLSTRLPLVLRLHPLDEARRLAGAAGVEHLIRRTQVAGLDLGVVSVAITANVPRDAAIAAVGVELYAPPNLAAGRAQAISETIELEPPQFAAYTSLRFAMGEDPVYRVRAYLVMENGDLIAHHGDWPSSSIAERGTTLVVNTAHLPARFVVVEPDAALLGCATLRCTCRWTQRGVAVTSVAEIGVKKHARRAVFIVPKSAVDATLDIEARSRSGPETIVLERMRADDARPGLYSFREFGPQRVAVTTRFASDATDFVDVDFQGQDVPRVDTLAFLPANAVQTWTWASASPFAAKFRYRIKPASWSPYLSPDDALTIDVGAEAKTQ